MTLLCAVFDMNCLRSFIDGKQYVSGLVFTQLVAIIILYDKRGPARII